MSPAVSHVSASVHCVFSEERSSGEYSLPPNGKKKACRKYRRFLPSFSPLAPISSQLKFVLKAFSVWNHPSVCDEQSFLFVQSFIISITKRRIEDNYIVWTNQDVRRSIYHGGREHHLTAKDWWPGKSVSGPGSLIWCKLPTVDSNLSRSFFLPLLKTISGFWSSEGVITNVGSKQEEGGGESLL